ATKVTQMSQKNNPNGSLTTVSDRWFTIDDYYCDRFPSDEAKWKLKVATIFCPLIGNDCEQPVVK
ncbi:MAG: hypothetical protein OEO19_17350, partial [Gammaproteobacteria bacterium]|nr:hypothetical protein [Gammaproteobacteria bacterium]